MFTKFTPLLHQIESRIEAFEWPELTSGEARALIVLAAFWLLVTLPLAWGLWATIRQAAVLFG